MTREQTQPTVCGCPRCRAARLRLYRAMQRQRLAESHNRRAA